MLCDVVEERVRQVQKLVPTAAITNEPSHVFENPDVDAVVIATPVRSHYELVCQALESRRHVLVEKPMATSSKDASDLVRAAKEHNLVLMVGHTFLYSPPVRKIKELLDDNAIGPILAIDSNRVNLGIFRGDVDVLWDLGPHDISIIMYLLGKSPETVGAGAASYMQDGISDTGYMHFGFSGGQIAHIFLSWLAPVKLRRMTIVGRQGMIVYDDTQEMEKVKIYRGDSTVLSRSQLFQDSAQLYRLGDIYIPSLPRTEPLRAQAEEFLNCIRNGCKPVSDGELGLQVVRILEVAYKSIQLQGQHVPFEWPTT